MLLISKHNDRASNDNSFIITAQTYLKISKQSWQKDRIQHSKMSYKEFKTYYCGNTYVLIERMVAFQMYK